jgi:CSLREA domain-containing protein
MSATAAQTRGAGLRFEVNSTADAVDALIGDGICATATGVCTLRAAIQEANGVPGTDVISLPIGTYMLTIPGANEDAAQTGDLDITDDLTIVGSCEKQTIIDAVQGFGDRVFHVLKGAHVQISNISIEHGSALCCGFGSYGGGIYNQGNLSLRNMSLRFNSAEFAGGGMYNAGSVHLFAVDVERNSSFVDGGIRNEGRLQFDRGFITQNRVSGGTGAMSNYDTATLTDVTVSNNTSDEDTGGVWTLANLTLDRDTFSGNTSRTYGGAVTVLGTGTVTIRNVTIVGNSAGTGGGVFNQGDTTLIDVTVDQNGAPSGGNVWNEGTVALYNTIVANSVSGDNCGGAITSGGHNLDSGSTCQLDQEGDLSNIDPLLGQLANNGGETQTQALLNGSPAIDAGSSTFFPPIDQRGVQRPVDGDGDGFAISDMGAYESTTGGLIGDGGASLQAVPLAGTGVSQ